MEAKSYQISLRIMKITTLRQLTPFIFLAFLGAVFTQCETDTVSVDKDFIGTWHQSERFINDNVVTKDSTRMLMQVNDNYICVLCDSTADAKKNNTIVKRTGWSFKDDYLNLAVDLPASWKVTVANSVLTMEKVDFTTFGTLQKTTIRYSKSPAISF